MKNPVRLMSFLIVALFAATPLIAQGVEKGTVTVAGDAGARYQSGVFSANVQPSYGRFISDHVLVGASLRTSFQAGSHHRSLGGHVGPFVAYYFDNGLFTDLRAHLGINTVVGNSRTGVIGTTGSVGYSMFLSPTVALEPRAYLSAAQLLSTGSADGPDWRTSGLDGGLAVGLRVYLNR